MTGHSGHDGRLRALRRALDPAAAGTALDWSRFRSAMGAWIAACRQDGAEEQDVASGDSGPVPAGGCWRWKRESGWPRRGHKQRAVSCPTEDNGRASPAAAQLQGDNVDVTTPAEAAGLRSRARQLATQNAKLQRDAELAEELNARLAEEIAQLQAQLRSSRQALEQARVAVEELDDMKAVAKQLEEENTELRRQARHANQRLLAEGQGLQEQIQAQAARMASLEAQLCRGTALLSARDAALAQAGQRAQELTAALEEYERVVQELRLETTRLRQQLGQMRDAWAMYGGTHGQGRFSGPSRVLTSASSPSHRRPWCPRSQLDIPATAVASQGTGDKEEEEDTGTALSGGGGLAGSSEEVATALVPQAPLSLWTKLSLLAPWTPLSPWALALLALLALLYLLPRQWPQPQLRYRSPPPL
ncbi:KASH5 protein, partial [Cettia cetti]|nr:KASH5 protein [Cettia cetti]